MLINVYCWHGKTINIIDSKKEVETFAQNKEASSNKRSNACRKSEQKKIEVS
jgi:hypothetical protein